MALFCPVASHIHHIAARLMSFRLNKSSCVMPKHQRAQAAVTTVAATLFAATTSTAWAQMSIPGKFGVNAAGAATYAIPIAVPPGIAGMHPSLTLEYNSQAPNGILGMQWSLGGLPAISRCAATIAQDGARGAITYTPSDRFCLDGQRLVAISGGYGSNLTEYRTEVDSFSKVVSHDSAGTGPAWFEVHTKSGQIMEFGNSGDSKILVAGGTARAWLVNKVSDTVGNFYTVQYQPDAGGSGHAYPQAISYAGNTINFVYAGGRPDTIRLYEAGAQLKTTMLLTNVQTSAPVGGVADYRLTYQQTSLTHRSFLTSVTLCDRAASPSCLPATTIGWNTGADGFSISATNAWLTPGGGNGVLLAQGDIDGDGRSDLIASNVDGTGSILTVAVMRSKGDGNYFGPDYWQIQGQQGAFSAAQTALADVDGDGRADLIVYFRDPSGFHAYVALSNGQTFSPSLQSWVSGNLAHWTDDSAALWLWNFGFIDIDGDGRADLIAYSVPLKASFGGGATLKSYTALATGGGNFGPAIYNAFAINSEVGSAVTALLADVNGDGRTDLIVNAMGPSGWRVFSALSNGDGTFAMPNPAGSLYAFNAQGWSATAGDLNGDGRADLLAYRANSAVLQVLLGFSQGDGTFAFQVGAGLNGNFDGWGVSLADLNGDGRTDLVPSYIDPNTGGMKVIAYLSNGDGTFTYGWGYTTNIGTGWQMFLSDLDGDGRSDIILFGFLTNPNNLDILTFRSPSQALAASTFTTGLGATTRVTYAPLTAAGVYTKGSGAVYPQQDTQGALYVVSRVDAPTGVASPASYTSTYGYWGARFDLAGRGFLGFSQMNTYDVQTGITTGTGFNQNFPFTGTVAWEWKGIWPQTLNSNNNTYQFVNASGASAVSSPSVASAPYRVSLLTSAAASNDLDGTTLPTITTSYQYDAFNNPTQVVVSTPDGYSKTTTNIYTNDTTKWFLGRLTRATVASTAPSN
jgi:Salmonella virulence plasmid 65kDa B protein/FG-GAP-like repeat/Insecticide toxin TcdB middle/N-terminal region